VGTQGLSPVPENRIVQVSLWEIDRGALAGPGARLDSLLADRSFDAVTDGWEDGLPQDGWRAVDVTPAHGKHGRAELLLAPLPEQDDALALVHLIEQDARWTLSADRRPVPVYPGKATRRHDLRLGWSRARSARVGRPLKLSITLRNTSSWRAWHNVADDHGPILGWLAHADGQSLRPGPFGWAGLGHPLPCLRPGDSVTLPVNVVTPDTETLPPGRYQLKAMVMDLGLRAEPGTLILRDGA
jgi:hypothetical protein